MLNDNATSYISINDLSDLISTGAIVENNQIVLDGESVKFAAGSFYCVYRDGDNIRVAQMSLPAITINSELYIPFNSLLSALSGIKLIHNELLGKGWLVKSNIFNKLNHEKPNRNLKPLDGNEVSKDNKKMLSVNDTNTSKKYPVIISDSISLPTKYIIPKSLIK